MNERFKQESINVMQGISVIIIYAIIWDMILIVLKKLPRGHHIIMLGILTSFMFLTSGNTFEFLKNWGL